MTRKKKSSPAEDIVEIVAVLPWWVGIALALILYFVLHSMASAQLATTAGSPEQLGQLLVGTLKKNLAAIGQYLLPFLCLIGTCVSVFRRQARKQLIDNVIAGTGSSALKEMSWQEFEQLVGEAFRRRGYSVYENGGGGADGGVDLVLKKGEEKFLVQCKQWRTLRVGVTVIRELYGVMAAGGAAGGFVVTCGRFTEEAKAFANGRNVVLLDGSELEKMIRQTQPGPNASPKAAPAPVNSSIAVPGCPTCGKSMLLRTAQRGANAGRKFWGCSAYPSCRGTVTVD
jgi:restriction system protein